jgi:hypothetical protein
MRMLGWIVLGLVVIVVATGAFVRFAPSEPERWHTDPEAATPGPGRFVVREEGGDMAGPVLPMPPEEALATFDRVVAATPRTEVLAGSPEDGRITYVTRSAVWGFPDYTTVEARDVDGGSRLVIHARLRFGGSDMGVNERRVRGWLEQVEP